MNDPNSHEFGYQKRSRRCPLGGVGEDAQAVKLQPGLYAISVNLLPGYPWVTADGESGRVSFGRDAFRRFRDTTPVARAGYSIHKFRVPTWVPTWIRTWIRTWVRTWVPGC